METTTKCWRQLHASLFTEQAGVSMTINDLEQIEQRARSGQPIDSQLILNLTAYLRDVLQAKVNAEAIASEALRKVRSSRNYTAEIGSRLDDDRAK